MIPFWKKAPFFRLLLPLIAGIMAEYYLQLPVLVLAFLLLSATLFLVQYQIFSSYRRFRHAYLLGIAIHIYLLSAGIAITMCHELRFDVTHFSKKSDCKYLYRLRIEEPPIERAKTYKAIASVTHLITEKKQFPVSGRCYVYFKKDETAKKLNYATIIYTTSIPKPIPISDTSSFDFRRYAALQKMYHQLYLKEKDYVADGIDPSFNVYTYLFQIRDYLIHLIHRFIPGYQNAAVAIALLTGYRAELDRALSAIYQSTGTIHVIAISGMHLALIYFLLQMIFRPLDRFRNLLVWKELSILIFLWLFSLLTGGGASVIRAVIMFSFISFGKLLNKKGGIENALATSAFFMLCYNPYLLWDIGFQLSYAAVLSLVIFMKPLYEMIVIQNPMLDGLWKMNAITLSAQILTLPLCIYHFNQMPVLFLPANIIAIPLSTLVLYLLLLLMAVASFSSISLFIGAIISWLIDVMNNAMSYLSRYRFAVVEGLSPDLIEICLLYVLIYFTYLFIQTAEKNYLRCGLATLVVLGLIQTVQFFFTFSF